MSMEYIRSTYKVPAKCGGRVVYTGLGVNELGTITGTRGAHILVRLDGDTESKPYHPTWEIQYLPWTAKEADRA